MTAESIGNRKRLTPRSYLFTIFAFFFAATLAFLGIRGAKNTEARADLSGFRAGNIISDSVMADYNSMSEAEINNFMHSKNSCNSHNFANAAYWEARGHTFYYSADRSHLLCLADIDFNGESAAHIIWSAAQYYRINPKVLLVTLEKEMSLITDTYPAAWNLSRATGYGCPDHNNGACSDSDSGFKNQVYGAAWLYRHVLDTNDSGYPAGRTVNVLYHPYNNCGTQSVYIENRATAALYRYTPYVPNSAALSWGSDGCSSFGNRNFYAFFTEWFGSTQGDSSSAYIPSGTYQIQTTAGLSISFADGTANGSSAVLADSNTSDKLQQFEAIRDGKYYRFRNIASGRYLDLYGASTLSGTKIELWDGNDSCAQKWIVESKDSGYYLVSACSSSAVIDIYKDAYGTTGATVDIWPRESSLAQTFVFNAVGGGVVENGTYGLKSSGDKLLTATDLSRSENARATLWENTTSNLQYYEFSRQPDGYYKIKSPVSGLYLATENESNNNGVYVVFKSDSNSCALKWGIEKNGGAYHLLNACSKKGLDIYGGGVQVSTNGARIDIWTENPSSAQDWTLIPRNALSQTVENGTFRFSNVASPSLSISDATTSAAVRTKNNDNNSQKLTLSYNSATGHYYIQSADGKYLAQANNSTDIVFLRTVNNDCQKEWIPVKTGNYYFFYSTCSDAKVIDAAGVNPLNGANVALYPLNGGNNQKWRLDNPDQTQAVEDGTYILESAVGGGGFALDVWGSAAPRQGTNVQIYPRHGGSTQQFRINYDVEKDAFSMTSLFSNTNVDAYGAVAHNGTNIQIWTPNPSCAQYFRISAIDNTYYRLTSLCDEAYSLDVYGAIPRAETNVQLWENNDSAAQKWKFIRVE